MVASRTDPQGRTTAYSYNAQGSVISSTNALGQVSTYSHDTAGRLASHTTPNGLRSSYSYDLRGRLLMVVTGDGTTRETTAYTYYPTGQLATALQPSGLQMRYAYDAAQRLIAVQDNRGNRISYTLDAMGNRVREEIKDQSNTLALAISRVINPLNLVAAVRDAQNQATQRSYNANGQAISQTDPLNQTTTQTLDGLKRPTAAVFADNAKASQSYSPLGEIAVVTDPKGMATTYSRNAFGEVTEQTSPDMGSISYQYNAVGELTQQRDARGNTTHITRDALGRALSVRSISSEPEHTAHTAHITYDADGTNVHAGYVVKQEDPSGSTRYERDKFGRITAKIQQINDNLTVPSKYKTSYSYDKGLLQSITYPSGLKVMYMRSTSGQIIGIDTQLPGHNKPVVPFVSGLSHTALGQPKAWAWVNGATAARVFDMDGRMTGNEFASYTFDAASRIIGITQSLTASVTATSAVTGTGTSTLTTSDFPSTLSWSVRYDNRDRIIGFNRPSAQASYSYDGNSNRLSAIDKKVSDTDLDGDFDATDKTQTIAQALNIDSRSNQLHGLSQTTTGTKGTRTLAITTSQVNYALDAAGNMITDGLRSFSYDSANRHSQTSISKDGEASKITYLYNALGQRVFKSEPQAAQYPPQEAALGADFTAWLKKTAQWLFAQAQSNATLGQSYVYADSGTQLPSYALLGEYGNGGASASGRLEYLWLPTEEGGALPIGLYKNGKFFAVHSDHLNTPRKITDEANKLVWQWPYSAFGDNKPTGILKSTTNPNNAYTQDPTTNARLQATPPTLTFNLRHPGQYFDFETGLFYNYFRSYQPNQGRYTQSDPIGLDGGFNRFGYVGGNALSHTDPLGLQAAAGARLGAMGGFALGGPPGAVTGGLLGLGAGALAGYGLDRMFNDDAADIAVYPDNPGNAEDKFAPIKGSRGKQCEDGSVWEKDSSSHGGDQWKRWPDRRAWERKKPPSSVWPDGRIRK